MKNLPKILLVIAVVVGVFLFARNCNSGCGKPNTDQATTDTTTVEIPGIVETDTPKPTIEVPPVDSSIFKQLEKYKRLYRTLQLENDKAELHWARTLEALQDTTLDLQSRYNILANGCNVQAERVGILRQYITDLEKKLEETANGNYVVEGKDSTDAYTMDWSINSFGPLKKDGFKRTVNVTQKTVTNTVTEKEYSNLSLAAIYGFTPNDLQTYSVQLGKDWKRFGVLSQFGITNDKDPIFSAGLKFNF